MNLLEYINFVLLALNVNICFYNDNNSNKISFSLREVVSI